MACWRPHCGVPLLLVTLWFDAGVCTFLKDEPLGKEALRALRGELRKDTKTTEARVESDREELSEKTGFAFQAKEDTKIRKVLEKDAAVKQRHADELKRLADEARGEKQEAKEKERLAEEGPGGLPAGLPKLVDDAGVEMRQPLLADSEQKVTTTAAPTTTVHDLSFWKRRVDQIKGETANATKSRNAAVDTNASAVPKGSFSHLKDSTEELVKDHIEQVVVDKAAEYKKAKQDFEMQKAHIVASRQPKPTAPPRAAKTVENARNRWLAHWASLHSHRNGSKAAAP